MSLELYNMHIAIMIQYQNAFSNSFLIDDALAYLALLEKNQHFEIILFLSISIICNTYG